MYKEVKSMCNSNIWTKDSRQSVFTSYDGLHKAKIYKEASDYDDLVTRQGNIYIWQA